MSIRFSKLSDNSIQSSAYLKLIAQARLSFAGGAAKGGREVGHFVHLGEAEAPLRMTINYT